MATPLSLDLTAILVPTAEHDPASIRRVVLAGNYGDVWLRMKPLSGTGFTQVELFNEAGGPRIDPLLVTALSSGGRHALFIHLNREADQALIHAFQDAKEVEGWMGKPEELDERVLRLTGKAMADLITADDGSRLHPTVASSAMIALVRGRTLVAPAGMPIALGSFTFHDRGSKGEDRVALVAYDPAALQASWKTPGAELAARVATLPEKATGPLLPLRAEVLAELAALGDASPASTNFRSVRALELLMLTDTYVFAAGDAVSYIDQRLLPMFSLTTGDAQLDDPDEAEELEARESVLEAMVEVLPYHAPEGSMMEQLSDAELRPLAQWTKPGEEYVGSVFALEGTRLRGLLSSLDQRDLAARIDRFYRAWWKAQTDDPADEAFEAWRQEMEEKGANDISRFLTDWTEWRIVMELAALNKLETALVFYARNS